MPVRLRAGNPFSGPLRVQCCLGVCVASRESSVGASVTREQKAPDDVRLQTDAAVSEHLRSEATQGARGIRPPVNETPQASAAVLRQKKLRLTDVSRSFV